jgi:phage tail sheath protein FI
MYIGTAPQGYDRDAIKTYASSLRARKVYGAVYAPWIQVVNPIDTTRTNPRLWITPVGHVMGTFARVAAAKGVWYAPAGSNARLRFALDTEFEMNDAEHTDLVKAGGVNGIRPIPGEGIVIDASRTLSTDTRWLFVGVRRLFNLVKSSLKEGLRWVPQEPHDQELRDKVRLNSVRPFLLGLWRRGAFGSEPAELTFTIKCDAENNPPAEVNLGRFTIEVYFYAVRPAETIVIKVGQQDAGATATDS